MTDLAKTPLFQSLPAEELQRVQETFAVQDIPTGAILVQEGQPGDQFYVILEGSVEIIKAQGTAEEMVLGKRGPGEYVGEMGLLNPDGLRTATVRAVETTRLLEVRFTDFTELLGRHPWLAYELAGVLSNRMTQTQNKTIHILQEKNKHLQQAYDELKAAQAQLVEKEKMEQELQLAREIQRSILPVEMPSLPDYDFGALMTPARMVGGDFFGIFPLDGDRMALIVGDVTDKGAPAAIFMAQIHALLRATAAANLSPAEVLQRVNDFLMEMNDKGLFATVIYGVLEQSTGIFEYARAGHELPLLVNAEGHVSFPEAGVGMPVGILDEPMIDENRLMIPPGGRMFLYSDGVTDCANLTGERFNEDGLIARILELEAQATAQQACQSIFAALVQFKQEAPQFDDITLLAVRRKLAN